MEANLQHMLVPSIFVSLPCTVIMVKVVILSLFAFSPETVEALISTSALTKWENVKLGSLEVAPIAFGTLNLPDNKQIASQILTELPKNTLVDTAELYGPNKNGEIERLLGSCSLENRFLATKFAPKPWRIWKRSVLAACQASCKRLQTQQIDLYQIHFPDPWGTKDEMYWEGLAECYHEGLIQNVGMCNYGPSMIRRAHQALTVERGVPLVSNQINFNLMRYRSSLETKQVCDDLGIKVLGYHPLGNGVLTGKYINLEKQAKTTDPFAPGQSKLRRVKWYKKFSSSVIEAVQQVATERNISCAQVALNWSLSKGVIPLTGVRTVDQCHDLLGTLKWKLTSEEVNYLDEASNVSAEYAMGFQLL